MHQKATLASILILVFGLSCNRANTQPVDSAAFAAACDKILTGQFPADEPGATVLVARHDLILYKKAFGMANLELQVPMQVEHVFRIGSITKQFTAVAVLQLVEQGKLSLQDDITKFIPDYPTQGNKITIEHLLTHTSGIQDYSGIKDTAKRGTVDFTPEEMIDYFKNRPVRFAPGTKWEYSNSGYFLLGYIIELVSGETYPEYLERHIFKPAGMSNSHYASDTRITRNRADGYVKSEYGFENAAYLSMTQPFAAGAIQSTVEDLFTWHLAVHSSKLITKASLDKALTRYMLSNGEETNYGYGWRFGYIQESPSIWHGGWINGFITMSLYLPDEDLFVAIFSNCECNSPEDVTAKIAALAIGDPYEYKAMILDDTLMGGYTGLYENAKGQFQVISVSDHQLFAQLGRGPKRKVTAYQQDKFVFEDDVMLRMEFAGNNRGLVDKLVLKSRKGHELWLRTDKPMPTQDGIKLAEKTLAAYIGEYEIAPDFTFVVSQEQDRLFVTPTGQKTFEIFAETQTLFFLKVNDAQLEFVKDDVGNVTKAILTQGGRKTEAKKIK